MMVRARSVDTSTSSDPADTGLAGRSGGQNSGPETVTPAKGISQLQKPNPVSHTALRSKLPQGNKKRSFKAAF